MSSAKASEVEPLELRGRGKKKQKEIVRRIRQEHGTPIISIPKKFFLELGFKLNQEVTIEEGEGSNLLNKHIIIKPRVQKKRSE